YGDRPAFVFTHRDLPAADGAVIRFMSGDVAPVLDEIDAATDRNVFLVGGAQLVRQFLEARAVDELHLFVVPVLLGDGIPLFVDAPRLDARLLGCELYSTGIAGL